ncbi:MAG: alpha-amylase family glycosyl hydrolase [Firmicutes bacterium]|nr:alpha-amylase family glycosyl hydrolase [Bacillota bacterium]MCM1393333.1 alpha-amylase family glycosyl hydrolase [[Eubacterium] siraeum]
MYNPLLHKTPYGATYVGGATKIKFPLDCNLQIKRVFIVLRQVFGEGGAIEGDSFRSELFYKGTDGGEDIFEGEITLDDYGIYKYRFEGVYQDGTLAFFGRGSDGCAIKGDWLPEWQLTVSKYAYKTPNWAKSGVIYQIFADRFCRVGNTPFNKSGRLHTYWNERPDIEEPFKDYRADDFFGGNAKGIISRLDYIKSLGVSCIYLSPIFKSSSNHRYDTGDYLEIDELFGSEEDFASLVEKAKKKGIAIILDGVFNHTGSDSKYFNREGSYPTLGAYQSKESPYYDWYYFDDYPTSYHCWWGSTVVPTVNKSASGFRQLLLGKDGVIDKWSKFGIAGWRLDVVDELPIEFTTELCKAIKDSGKDMLIVGEVWEDASTKIAYDEWRPYFMGGQLDSVMNYPFKEAILAYSLDGDKDAFISKVSLILENYPKQSLDTLMNLIDSHDTVRALTYLSGVTPPDSKHARADFKLSEEEYALAKKRLFFASALQYTLAGVPCLYYGDEAGVQGFEDPLNRGTYPWGHEDKDIIEHYKSLGKMRKEYADLLAGETAFIPDEKLLIFARKSEKGTLSVYANATDETVTRPCCGKDAITGKKIKRELAIAPMSVRIIINSV